MQESAQTTLRSQNTRRGKSMKPNKIAWISNVILVLSFVCLIIKGLFYNRGTPEYLLLDIGWITAVSSSTVLSILEFRLRNKQ
jgi:hypothetical protein